jgi:hypothetical protein
MATAARSWPAWIGQEAAANGFEPLGFDILTTWEPPGP